MATKRELYVMIDVETDGPCPGVDSMLSLGAAAYDLRDGYVDGVEVHLHELPVAGALKHPETKAWWDKNREAYEYTRTNQVAPAKAMETAVTWMETLAKERDSKLVLCAAPSGFDFTFFYWYAHWFLGRSPTNRSCLDVKSLVMGVLGTSYDDALKSQPPEWLKVGLPHSHKALDDAKRQGAILMNILRSQRKESGSP